MKDLVCVVADKQIGATLEELLLRRHALGIRPVEVEILLHPNHDSGCYSRPRELLDGYRQAAEHALIVLDHAWEGVPAKSGAALEGLIDKKLEEAGMAGWAAPVVIEPELEAWVFSASPHVPDVLGWKGSWSAFRETLEQRNLWSAADAKPADPKAAIEYVLGRTGKSRSASLFRRLARRVNTAGCQDRAFRRLKELLQAWFPPVSSAGGGGQRISSTRGSGQPNGRPLGRTHNVERETRTRKKLIEVALPLDDINAASAREKSIRHGHPSTLHLWWARRPLAAARAVIFAQLLDDPSAHPELFPTEKAQERERKRLFGIIRELVKWKNTTNEVVLEQAREEIRESWRRTCADNAKHARAAELFDPDRLPAFHDPFAGGGALPLEAQRLGLKAYASDLNPVAVLINKAMIEIPPKFADRPPVNPESRAEQTVVDKTWRGAQGLADDVRYYGRWIRDEAEKRIGRLYPPVEITPALVRERPDLEPYENRKLTVIAWLWTRTVKSPNPAFADTDVPLASTFMLSTKMGKEAYVEPVIEGRRYRFTVRVGAPPDAEAVKRGTTAGKRRAFRCLMSGVPMTYDHVRTQGKQGGLGARLMAIVAEGDRGRVYVGPTPQHETVAHDVPESWKPDMPLPNNPRDFKTPNYGLLTFADLFTPRQLVALTTFSDLVGEAMDRLRSDAAAAGAPDDERPLRDGGTGAAAYAEAVSVYLAFAVDRVVDRHTSISTWDSSPSKLQLRNTFARQAIPMTWDFGEGNPFCMSSGTWLPSVEWVAKSVSTLPPWPHGEARQAEASTQGLSLDRVISTDPPYYDNIGYADLSDFFYVWLRCSLKPVFPELLATLVVPKTEELVATPYRHGGRAAAETFFLDGMTAAMRRLAQQAHPGFPVTIYYAFKQSERKGNAGISSTGWETFLDAVIGSGFAISGTWPMRTELGNRMIGRGTNALASSIVLVCRQRTADGEVASRRQFLGALRSELPGALADLQTSNIAPVDLAQAAIGPGMAVFTRYDQVLEADGSPMSVRSALGEINRMLDEMLARQEGDLDADTRFCVAWYEQYGMAERAYGEAEVLFNAKNTSFEGLRSAGVIAGGKGKVRIRGREELDLEWDPASDRRVSDWEGAQQLTRALTAEQGGGVAEAARLVLAMGGERAERARALAYRLYALADRKKWADEAYAYNVLVTSWPQIQAEAARLGAGARAQGDLALAAAE